MTNRGCVSIFVRIIFKGRKSEKPKMTNEIFAYKCGNKQILKFVKF